MMAFETSTPWLAIPQSVQTESWQQSSALSATVLPGSRWQAYLNQVCLQTLLPWLREHASSELGESPIEPEIERAQPGFWELVNGSAVMLGETRLILVPTEAMDRSEFRVPQEWVDCPDCIGDYYFAIEVDADEQQVQIWGYTTHETLKAEGQYDATDRTYCLSERHLIQDMTVFWVMQQLPPEPTRSQVPALPELTSAAAESFIQRLSAIAVPRLELPFQQWGALFQQQEGLQRLMAQRAIAQPPQAVEPPPLAPLQPWVNLSQWLQNGFETGWQAIADLLGSEPEFAVNLRRDDTVPSGVQRVKRLQLGEALPDVLLVVMLDVEADDRRCIGARVLPQTLRDRLPENLQLSLRSGAGAVLQSVQSGQASHSIQLRRFRCAPGTQFYLQIDLAETSIPLAFTS